MLILLFTHSAKLLSSYFAGENVENSEDLPKIREKAQKPSLLVNSQELTCFSCIQSISVPRCNKALENIYFCFIDYAKAFDCVNHNKLWKILKENGKTRPPDLPLEKPVCRSGSNS